MLHEVLNSLTPEATAAGAPDDWHHVWKFQITEVRIGLLYENSRERIAAKLLHHRDRVISSQNTSQWRWECSNNAVYINGCGNYIFTNRGKLGFLRSLGFRGLVQDFKPLGTDTLNHCIQTQPGACSDGLRYTGTRRPTHSEHSCCIKLTHQQRPLYLNNILSHTRQYCPPNCFVIL